MDEFTQQPEAVEQHQDYIAPKAPVLDPIKWSDILRALKSGMADFVRAPVFGLFFGAVFALSGLGMVAILITLDMPWLVLPILIGFPLIGPFAATGLYEVSRNLSAQTPITWRGILLSVFHQRERQLGWMAFVMLFIFWVWIYLVRVLIALFMGFGAPSTIVGFAQAVISTQNGMAFLVVGSLIGAVLALFLFAATVIAMPLLLDTELDFVSAVITSIKTVSDNFLPMLGWGLIIGVLLVVGMIPAFLGLLIVLPVLGHATWHLYANARASEIER